MCRSRTQQPYTPAILMVGVSKMPTLNKITCISWWRHVEWAYPRAVALRHG